MPLFVTPGPVCATRSRPNPQGVNTGRSAFVPSYNGKRGTPDKLKVKAQLTLTQGQTAKQLALVERQNARLAENQIYAKTANVRAFLKAISIAEGGDYNLKYGGFKGRKNDPYQFSDFSTHPGKGYQGKTAAGMYQITKDTWQEMGVQKMGITDFTPEHQDLMAVEILRKESALNYVLAGDLPSALGRVAKRWAALLVVPTRLGNTKVNPIPATQKS